MEIKIYLGNLGLYNEGISRGKWITLPCENLQKELEKIGVKDGTQYEEYHIQDFECPFFDVHRYDSLEALNALAEEIEQLDEEQKNILAKIKDEYPSTHEGVIQAVGDIENVIVHNVSSVKELGMELLEGLYEVPANLTSYFDYEAYARDMMSNGNFVDATEDPENPMIIEIQN